MSDKPQAASYNMKNTMKKTAALSPRRKR